VCSEFVRALLALQGRANLRPVDPQEVVDKQVRATQVALLDKAIAQPPEPGDRTPIRSAQKSEAYQKPAAPRNISPSDERVKVWYSVYIYAIAAFLKSATWYAFGHTPSEIAQIVADICRTSVRVLCTDYSRWDGRLSSLLRQAELWISEGLFSQEHRAGFKKWWSTTFNNSGRTRFGVLYQQLYTRGSGFPETSTFNTLLNAFLTFWAAYRIAGFQVAYDVLVTSIFGGDDGLVGVPIKHESILAGLPQELEKLASEVGMLLELEVVERGEMGVTFLSRIFSKGVWYGGVDTCCDILRTLSKLHVSTSRVDSMPNGKDLLQVAQEKLIGLWFSDRNTPVVGEFVREFAQRMGNPFPTFYETAKGLHAKYVGWWVKQLGDAPDANSWPNRPDDGWKDAYLHSTVPELDMLAFKKWLNSSYASVQDWIQAAPTVVGPTHVVTRAMVGETPPTAPPPVVPKPAPSRKRGRRKTKSKHKGPSSKPIVPLTNPRK